MSLIYFILCSYGITQILAFAKVFDFIRPKHHFFSCPMCIGFWVGVFLMILNPYTELFTFKVSLVNALLLGSLSSATSYALCMLITEQKWMLRPVTNCCRGSSIVRVTPALKGDKNE